VTSPARVRFASWIQRYLVNPLAVGKRWCHVPAWLLAVQVFSAGVNGQGVPPTAVPMIGPNLGTIPSDCNLGAASRQIDGVSCEQGCCGPEATWKNWGAIPWEVFAHGEYVGPACNSDVDEYRMRVRDQLEFVYLLTREESKHAYELNVGDEVRVELFAEKDLDRQLTVQPDGTITVPLLGQIRAARRTVGELQDVLEEQFTKFYKDPNVTVTPFKINARLEDLRATVDARQGFGGGQSRRASVTPEGTVQLVAIGSVPAQG